MTKATLQRTSWYRSPIPPLGTSAKCSQCVAFLSRFTTLTSFWCAYQEWETVSCVMLYYKHGTITIHNTDMRAEIFMCITPWCCEHFNGGNGYQPDPQTNLWLFNVKETTLWLVSPPLRVVSQIFQFLAIFMIPYLGNYQQEWNDVYTKLLLV